MNPRKAVSYFPLDPAEQALVVKLRDTHLPGGPATVLRVVELLEEARLGLPELERALERLRAEERGADLERRFAELEARLVARLDGRLAGLEAGRVQAVADAAAHELRTPSPTPPGPPAPAPRAAPAGAPPPAGPDATEPPADAVIAWRVRGEVVSGPSAAQFYAAVWRWLFQHGLAGVAELPIRGSGKRRYVVAAEPVHPGGNPFTRAAEVVPGVFVEVNLSRGDILRRSRSHLAERGLAFEVLREGGE